MPVTMDPIQPNRSNTQLPKRDTPRQRTISQSEVVLCKLPVPDLQETLEQYLLCVKPLVNEAQFERTKKLVEDFGKPEGDGEFLQQRLQERSRTKTNWVEFLTFLGSYLKQKAYDWWLNDMYLDNRAPLPVNSNPGMVLPKRTFHDEASMLRYAAKLTSGILDFKVILDARALPVDIARGQLAGQHLCMEQYYRLLNSYRLPGFGRDNLVTVKNNTANESEHVIVMCNNQIFVLHVSEHSRRLTEADFFVQLERITKLSRSHAASDSPVGILTSMGRNDWAETRQILMTDCNNQRALDMIERSVFILCLDQPTFASSDAEMARQMLYGKGPNHNSCNRWYDKTIQLIISRDGAVGLSYEHSASEGIAVTALIEHLIKYVSIQEVKGLYRSDSVSDLPPPKRLQWNFTGQVESFIEQAKHNVQKMADNLDLKILRFNDYGKGFIKRQNISPDAFVQVALQLTYYKLYQKLVSTYESASIRRFREGRVDNIRAATLQVLDFAKSLVEPDDSGKIKMDAKKMLLLRRAIKAQTEFTIAAITGHGIDCHLLGLKRMAEEMSMPEPDMFADPSFALSNYFQLSTSQIPTSTDSFMCYGAVVPDGYGASYNPRDDSIIFCISSFRSCPSTSSEKFGLALLESMHQMQDLCLGWNKRRSSSLEHLARPRKLTLHRRLDDRSVSTEDDTLREDLDKHLINEAVKEQKNLSRQQSLTNFWQVCPGDRLPSTASNRMQRSNMHKLRRRSSDLAISRPAVQSPAYSLTPQISPDLMEILQSHKA